jgi:hypothetical protein
VEEVGEWPKAFDGSLQALLEIDDGIKAMPILAMVALKIESEAMSEHDSFVDQKYWTYCIYCMNIISLERRIEC